MRILTVLAAATLLGSAYLAARHYRDREPSFPTTRFVTPDPAARAAGGGEAKALGVALGGFEEIVRERPDDLDALRGLFRTTLTIGSVGLGQPGIEDRVHAQAKAYLARRDALDPDGALLKEVVRQWADGRLRVDWYNQAGFYACSAMAIFCGARGDPKGPEALLTITTQGDFYLEFFPFTRRYHPGWPGVEPLVAHYLEQGNLAARVEAGMTLLDYHSLFGVGGELLERHRPAIRDSLREMLREVRAFTDVGTSDVGRAAIMGTALLANLGDEEAARVLGAVKTERDIMPYGPHADTMRLARFWAGFESFSAMGPLTPRFRELHTLDQELYFLGVAHRAAHLVRRGASEEEIGELLGLLEFAFDSPSSDLRVLPMQALLRLAPARGAVLVRRGIDGGGAFSIFAGSLAAQVQDRPALFLPALSSREPQVAALAAASLLELPFPHALQR
jgi:hypothetical protein